MIRPETNRSAKQEQARFHKPKKTFSGMEAHRERRNESVCADSFYLQNVLHGRNLDTLSLSQIKGVI